MSKHAKSQPIVDTGYSPVLADADLTVMEAAALMKMARDAYMTIPADQPAMWQEAQRLYVEVRSVFLRKFFEIPIPL
jgi:hypothetical protein